MGNRGKGREGAGFALYTVVFWLGSHYGYASACAVSTILDSL